MFPAQVGPYLLLVFRLVNYAHHYCRSVAKVADKIRVCSLVKKTFDDQTLEMS